MLSLPTDATVEAMNIPTDRRHSFHTYSDHSSFRQFAFTERNIVVNTDNVERDWKSRTGRGDWNDVDASVTINVSRWFLYSNGSTSKLNFFFLSYFSSPVIIQINSSLALKVVQKYVNRWTGVVKWLCYWFIKSFAFKTKCSNHRVIKKKKERKKKRKRKKTQLVDDNFIDNTQEVKHNAFRIRQNKSHRRT